MLVHFPEVVIDVHEAALHFVDRFRLLLQVEREVVQRDGGVAADGKRDERRVEVTGPTLHLTPSPPT